jgi:hypothetical protein
VTALAVITIKGAVTTDPLRELCVVGTEIRVGCD